MKKVHDTKTKKYVLNGYLKRNSIFIIKFEMNYVKNGYSKTFKHSVILLGVEYKIEFAIYNKFIEDGKKYVLSKGRQVECN